METPNKNEEKIKICQSLLDSGRLSPRDVQEVRLKISLLKLGQDVEIGTYTAFSKG